MNKKLEGVWYLSEKIDEKEVVNMGTKSRGSGGAAEGMSMAHRTGAAHLAPSSSLNASKAFAFLRKSHLRDPHTTQCPINNTRKTVCRATGKKNKIYYSLRSFVLPTSFLIPYRMNDRYSGSYHIL